MQSDIFKCKRCGKIFDRNFNLQRHLKRKIPCKLPIMQNVQNNANVCPDNPDSSIEEKSIECKYCKKTFSSISTLNRHIRISCKFKKEVDQYKSLFIMFEEFKKGTKRKRKGIFKGK